MACILPLNAARGAHPKVSPNSNELCNRPWDSHRPVHCVRKADAVAAQKGVRKVACAFCLWTASSSRRRASLAFASAALSSHALGYLHTFTHPELALQPGAVS